MPVLNRAAKALKHPVFQTVARVADELGLDTYVIGGYVRDALLERGNAKDIDFVAVGSGIELAKAVAQNLPNRPKVQIFKNYGTAMLQTQGLTLELSVRVKSPMPTKAAIPRFPLEIWSMTKTDVILPSML